jgi:hypothetical protein
MARTDVTTTKISGSSTATGLPGDIADPAGVAVDVANGMRVVCVKARKTFVRVSNTSASTRVVTIRKPTTSPPEYDSSANVETLRGDYASTAIAATTGVRIFGPFNSGYQQADGGIYLDFVAGHTGVVQAFEIQP